MWKNDYSANTRNQKGNTGMVQRGEMVAVHDLLGGLMRLNFSPELKGSFSG